MTGIAGDQADYFGRQKRDMGRDTTFDARAEALTEPLPDGTVGQPYAAALSATGGAPPAVAGCKSVPR